MTAPEPSATPNATDSTLRQIINVIESNPTKPGIGVEVTLYLPWGAAVGAIVPAWSFDQKVAGYLRDRGFKGGHHKLADLGEDVDPVQGELGAHASDEYVHLSDPLCYLNGGIYRHDRLRVRLADVSAWKFAHGHRQEEH